MAKQHRIKYCELCKMEKVKTPVMSLEIWKTLAETLPVDEVPIFDGFTSSNPLCGFHAWFAIRNGIVSARAGKRDLPYHLISVDGFKDWCKKNGLQVTWPSKEDEKKLIPSVVHKVL